MVAIAGLQDFRQEGPPADTGTYQLPCSVMVFQHTFSGIDYICAIRSGERGWVLVDYGIDASTVIQSGVDGLTAGRTWKEKVILKGSFIHSGVDDEIDIPSYTIVELQGKITLADGGESTIFLNSDPGGGNIHIEFIGGIYNGNKANQVGTLYRAINLDNVDYVKISTVYVYNFNREGVLLENCRYATICDSWARNNDYSGFRAIASGQNESLFINFYNLYSGYNFWNNIDCAGITFLTIDSCFVEYGDGAGVSGIAVVGNADFPSEHTTIVNCHSRNNDNHGFSIDTNNRYVDISGCHGIGNTGDGIAVFGSLYIDIHDNFLRLNAFGILVDRSATGGGFNASHIKIHDNMLLENIGEDIRLQESANIVNGIEVYDNTLRSGTTPRIFIDVGVTDLQIYNNKGYVTENNVLSADFAIDAIAVVTVTIAHGLAVTPAVEDCQLTVVESTDVDDWEEGYVKVESVGAANVVCKVNVTNASATGGARAKLALHCDLTVG